MENAIGPFNGARELLILSAVRRGTYVLAALVLGALAACSDPRAGTLPTPTPSASTASPTATPSPTTNPEDSVRRALRAYFDALYAAGMDPANKTDELAALIHPSCTCRKVVDVLREEAKRGRHVDYTYVLRDVRIIDVSQARSAVQYTVRQSRGALRDRSGRAVETYPASEERFTAQFVRERGGWLLARLDAYR